MNRVKMVEKLVLAKAKLKEREEPRHGKHCMFELDFYGPCTCGASKLIKDYNEPIRLLDEMIQELITESEGNHG